jgi:hypothetical protein
VSAARAWIRSLHLEDVPCVAGVPRLSVLLEMVEAAADAALLAYLGMDAPLVDFLGVEPEEAAEPPLVRIGWEAFTP